MILFCCICKRHVEVDVDDPAEAVQRFRSFGHDDRKVAQLRRGPVGVYDVAARDVVLPPAEIVDCFENTERVAA